MSITEPNSRPSTMRMWKKFGEMMKSMMRISASAASGQTTLWRAMASNVVESEDCFVVVVM